MTIILYVYIRWKFFVFARRNIIPIVLVDDDDKTWINVTVDDRWKHYVRAGIRLQYPYVPIIIIFQVCTFIKRACTSPSTYYVLHRSRTRITLLSVKINTDFPPVNIVFITDWCHRFFFIFSNWLKYWVDDTLNRFVSFTW